MSSLLQLQIKYLLTKHPILVPLKGYPIALNNSTEKWVDVANICNPVYTNNKEYSFITELGVEKNDTQYNEIASEIRERDMYGNVIIFNNKVQYSI